VLEEDDEVLPPPFFPCPGAMEHKEIASRLILSGRLWNVITVRILSTSEFGEYTTLSRGLP
jgi:hypothetical protein